MQRVATYISPISPASSEALYNIQQIVSTVSKDEALFPDHAKHIDGLLTFFSKETSLV
jgi:hypothetical protein